MSAVVFGRIFILINELVNSNLDGVTVGVRGGGTMTQVR